jgi:hypothetical protein
MRAKKKKDEEYHRNSYIQVKASQIFKFRKRVFGIYIVDNNNA